MPINAALPVKWIMETGNVGLFQNKIIIIMVFLFPWKVQGQIIAFNVISKTSESWLKKMLGLRDTISYYPKILSGSKWRHLASPGQNRTQFPKCQHRARLSLRLDGSDRLSIHGSFTTVRDVTSHWRTDPGLRLSCRSWKWRGGSCKSFKDSDGW